MQLKSCILHKCCLLHKPSCDSPSPLEDSFPTLHLASQPWDVAGFPMPDIQVTAKACHVTKLNHCSPHNVCLSTGPPENTAHSHHSCNYVRKVIADAELVNSKPLLLGKYRVRYLAASGHNIFTSWSIHNLVLTVCICLKAPYLIDITESSTGNLGPSALQLTPTRSLSNSCIFSLRHFLVFLPNSRQHWSTGLGGHFQQQRHQQKTHKCEKRGTK